MRNRPKLFGRFYPTNRGLRQHSHRTLGEGMFMNSEILLIFTNAAQLPSYGSCSFITNVCILHGFANIHQTVYCLSLSLVNSIWLN